MNNNSSKKIVTAATIFVMVLAGIFGVVVFGSRKDGVTTANNATGQTGTAVPTTSTPAADEKSTAGATQRANKYKNGTYTATGSYDSPGGMDQLGVTLTLQNDVVVSLSVTPMANDRESNRYQQRFIGGVGAIVVGKNIDSLNVAKVSGSSLTAGGFNDALAQIKIKAQA